MSGSRPTSAEQHLGDRLSALVDGELGHEARERVLAHLATCPKCKAEADAQRRLKSVFAEAAPPPPSESFLARLQGLPGGGDPDGGGSPLGGGRFGSSGVFDMRSEDSFGYVPTRPHGSTPPWSEGRGIFGGRGHSEGRGLFGTRSLFGERGLPGGGGRPDRGLPDERDLTDEPDLSDRAGLDAEHGCPGEGGFTGVGGFPDKRGRTPRRGLREEQRGYSGERGFRIHDVRRPEVAASRGRRFAFVAAGAVSLAAIALGGVTGGVPADTADARGGPGSNATPFRSQGSGALTVPDTLRRRPAGLPGHGQRSGAGARPAPVDEVDAAAPLLPGTLGRPPGRAVTPPLHELTAPVVAGAAVTSPLIPTPLTGSPPRVSGWPTAPAVTVPGLLTAPWPALSPSASPTTAASRIR